jgi:uncharacterized protein (UPF0332 family)
MPYERLIKTGRIKPYTTRSSEIQQLLQVAYRDLNTAEKNLENAPDWAYSIAYNSVLQASRALMFNEGYRPRGGEQHITVVEFIEEKLGPAHTNQVRLLDQMRRKRHRVIYEVASLVSQTEAKQAIAFAEKFVKEIAEIITSRES